MAALASPVDLRDGLPHAAPNTKSAIRAAPSDVFIARSRSARHAGVEVRRSAFTFNQTTSSGAYCPQVCAFIGPSPPISIAAGPIVRHCGATRAGKSTPVRRRGNRKEGRDPRAREDDRSHEEREGDERRGLRPTVAESRLPLGFVWIHRGGERLRRDSVDTFRNAR